MKNLIILSVLVISFAACKKEKYTGSVSFWFSGMKAHNLQDGADVTTLTFYVDDEFISTVDISDHLTSFSAPEECNGGQFLYTDKMYRKETAKHSYKIVDQSNNVIWK